MSRKKRKGSRIVLARTITLANGTKVRPGTPGTIVRRSGTKPDRFWMVRLKGHKNPYGGSAIGVGDREIRLAPKKRKR